MALQTIDASNTNKWRIYIKITEDKLPALASNITSTDGAVINGNMEDFISLDILNSVLSYEGYLEIGKCAHIPMWDNIHSYDGINNYGGSNSGMVTFFGSVDMISLWMSENWSTSFGYNDQTVNVIFVSVEENIVRQFHGVKTNANDIGEEDGRQIVRWIFNKESISVDRMSTYTEFINITAPTGWLFVDQIIE